MVISWGTMVWTWACSPSTNPATARPPASSTPGPTARHRKMPRPAELDPVRIDARSNRVLVPRDLFEKGLALLKAHEYTKAALVFGRIPRLFPRWAGRWSAHYNQAVALERAGRFRTAARHYALVRRHSPDRSERLDATIRLALCLAWSGRPKRGLAILDALFHRQDTDDRHFLDAACAAARIHIRRKEFDEADRVLERALELARLSASPKSLASRAARCALWYARVAEARMEALALELPPRRLERAILRKSDLFTEARIRYFKVLDHGQAGWSALALERLAAMFEKYFWAVMRAPLPPFRPVLYYDGKQKRWKTLPAARVRRRYAVRLKRNLRSAMKLAIRVYDKQLDNLATSGWSEAVLAPARHRMARFARLVRRMASIPIGAVKSRPVRNRPGPRQARSPGRQPPMPCPFMPIPTGLADR